MDPSWYDRKGKFKTESQLKVILPVISREISLEIIDAFRCIQSVAFVDIILVLSGRVMNSLLRSVGYNIHRSPLYSPEMLTDAESIYKGDILSIENRVLIVQSRKIMRQSESHQRIFLKLMSTENKLLSSERVKMYGFSFQPGDWVVVAKSTKKARTDRLKNVEQMEEALVPLLFSKNYLLKDSVFCTNITISQCKSVQNGDFVFFIHEGNYYRGIVTEIRFVPSIVCIDAYHVDNNGMVIEKREEMNLNLTKVWRHRYMYDDMDLIVRDRILHMMSTLTYQYIMSYSGFKSIDCFVRNISKRLVIKMEDIQVQTNEFPRIQNLHNWMYQQGCLQLPDHLCDKIATAAICFLPKVMLVSSTETTSHLSHILGMKAKIVNIKHFLLPRRANEIFLETERCQLSPYVTVCVLDSTENGTMTPQDKNILKVIQQGDLEKCVFLLTRSCQNDCNNLRKTVSDNIAKIVYETPKANSIYLNIFFANESEFQKRLGYVIENQINSQIKNQLQELQALPLCLDFDVDTNANKQISSYAHTLRLLCKALPSENVVTRHRLEVLLQRTKDIEAFSFEGGKLEVFSQSSEAALNDKFLQFLTSDEMKSIKLTVKPWTGPPKTIPFQLKQGSKIKTTNTNTDDGFGTVGMFLRDSNDNIYFTTCGHVIGNDAEAYSDDADSPVVGKSVYARKRSSITDEIDISVIKVEEQFISDCQYGLRDPNDRLVEGIVSHAHDDEMKNMRLYKWGAKTNLTRGTYKGMLCLRKGETFENRLIYIEGNANGSIFAEKGDSGSLICFEATRNPQFSRHSGAFIFVGRCESGDEYVQENRFTGLCYHVNDVSRCSVEQLGHLEPMLKPRESLEDNADEHEQSFRCTIV